MFMTDTQDTERIKAQFISMITHELRSPLNSINGYLDLALEGIAGELNQQQREFVQRARAGSEHLYALIEDLLLISRADAGQLRLHRDLIRLPEIVANAIEELELIAKDNEISIRVDIASDFPPIYADAVRMQHVLRNLIKNALRFTPPGGSVTISARVKNSQIETAAAESIETIEEQQQIEIQIRDTGFGIAPEYQERIFERFYQIPIVDAGRAAGQGLGLTIVKMIVELHGGQVSVESMPGAGSTFKITISH
jgi:signal transduction histidine kinase